MRLVVLEMDRLAAGSVNWGRMVAGMLSQGVTMVVIPDASQHVSMCRPACHSKLATAFYRVMAYRNCAQTIR